MINCVGIFLGIFLDTSTLNVLQLHYIVELCTVDTIGIVDVTVRVGEGENLGTKLDALLSGILGNITRTRDKHLLAFEADAACLKH